MEQRTRSLLAGEGRCRFPGPGSGRAALGRDRGRAPSCLAHGGREDFADVDPKCSLYTSSSRSSM